VIDGFCTLVTFRKPCSWFRQLHYFPGGLLSEPRGAVRSEGNFPIPGSERRRKRQERKDAPLLRVPYQWELDQGVAACAIEVSAHVIADP